MIRPRVHTMNTMDASGNDTETAKKPVSNLRIFLGFVVCMSLGIFIYFQKNEKVLLGAMVLVTILEFVNLLRMYNGLERFQAISEGAWFLVMLSIFLGPYRHSLMDHLVFTYATIFYRPYATNYCNPRLALGVGLMIMVAVLPVTCGIVTDTGLADLLAALYLLLVASLWAFCSKLGAKVFGFEQDSTNG